MLLIKPIVKIFIKGDKTMFDKKNYILNQETHSSRIKTRDKGNISLSYIERKSLCNKQQIKYLDLVTGLILISKLEHVSQEQNQNQNHVILL